MTLEYTLNRSLGTMQIVSQDRIYIRDESVDVIVRGFTAAEVDETDGIAPWLQIIHGCEVLAEVELAAVENDDEDVKSVRGTLNTNTVQLLRHFNPCAVNVSHQFDVRVFATAIQKPIAVGTVMIWNFPAGGQQPDNVPAGSAILADVKEKVETHIADKSNPHEVTKAQIGLGNVDNTSDANKPVSTAQETRIAGVESAFNTALNMESATRQAADAAIDAKADSASAAVQALRTYTNSLVNNERASRISGDLSNTNAIRSEVTRATASETSLSNGIVAETSRATAAEASLASSVSALTSAAVKKADFASMSVPANATLKQLTAFVGVLLEKLKGE